MALRDKQAAFVEHYLICFNASEAARRAGYSDKTAGAIGWENLKKPEIAEVISRRLQETAMGADEVLMRLAAHARSDMGEWLSDDGYIDIAAMKEQGATHLLKKVKRTERSGETKSGGIWQETRIEVELHDALAALVHLGKHHRLFADRVEHSGTVNLTKGYVGVTPDEWDKAEDAD